MRKWMIGGVLLTVLFASTAYAHVAGSFGDFLVGVKDESTTEKLRNEINETKEEIERLTPRVEQMEAEYIEKADVAVTKLQFYNTIGLDTYMNFILQSDDVVDILANQRIIEKKIEGDLWELNQLYLAYMPLKLAKDSLEGHVKVLNMIQDNLQAREEFFAKNKDLTPEEMASLTVINWAANAGSLDEVLQKDSDLLNGNIKEFVTRKTASSPYRLDEELFNQRSDLTYYFRSDHVYVNFRNKDADVILIGTVSKNNENTGSLQFEAGFLNGILLSSELLEQLPGFKIDYSKLNPKSKGFFVEHMNGAIVIQPAEQAVE
jgi:hypothetical protein